MKLPELPPPPREHKRLGQVSERRTFGPDGTKLLDSWDESYPVYTADQLRSYALQCMERVREECAKVCEALHEEQGVDALIALDCAAAIRDNQP